MGFFKNLGNSISKVAKGISLKNAIKVVSGNGGEVAKDMIDRATGGFKPSKSTPKPKTTLQTNMESALVKTAQQGSTKVFNNLVTKASGSLSKSSTLNTINEAAAKFGSAIWFQSNWKKYKVAIIAGIIAVVGVIAYFIFRKKPKKAYVRR